MLQLIFNFKVDTPLKFTFALGRYKRFWTEHQDEIMNSFAKHTGLKFKQRKITVRVIDEPTSRAGTRHSPMELTTRREDPIGVGTNLIHELAHRLAIGNGIDADQDGPAWAYHCHRYIDLFLYDVWVDVMGEEAAQKALDGERNNTYDTYRKAWDWALAMSYDERQQALKKLKKKYIS